MKLWTGAGVGLLSAWLAAVGCGATDSHRVPVGSAGAGGSGARGGAPSGEAGADGKAGGAGTRAGSGGGMVGEGGAGTRGGSGGRPTAGGAGSGSGPEAGAGGETDAGSGGEGGAAAPDCVVARDGVLDWDVVPAYLTGNLTLNGAA